MRLRVNGNTYNPKLFLPFRYKSEPSQQKLAWLIFVNFVTELYLLVQALIFYF